MTKVRRPRLGDVMELRRDPIAIEASKSYRKIGIYSWGRGVIRYEPTAAAEMGSLRYFRFPKDAVVFSNIQAWEQAVAVSTAEDASDFVCSNRFLPYVGDPEEVDPRFIFHFMLSEPGHSLLLKASPGTQVRNRTLGKKLLEDSKIPLPDLPEQHRIATHLDRIADLSAQTSGEWQSPRNALTDRLVRDIPRHPIGSFASQAADAVPVIPSDAYRTLGLMNRGRGCFARPIFTGADTKYRTLFRVAKGQLIFSKLFAWEGSVTVVPESFDGMLVSSEFPTYDLDLDRASPRYVAHLTKWHGIVDELASATTGMGQRRQRVMPDQFEGVRVPLPNLDTQERIADVLDLVTTVEKKMSHRATVANALLPAARNAAFNQISGR